MSSSKEIIQVDDAKMVGFLMQSRLRPLGYSVSSHTNPIEALAEIQSRVAGQRSPDLVITDGTMHEMDGLEFARQVRLTSPEIAILLVTGHPDKYTPFKREFDDIVTKPYSLTALKEGGENAIRNAQLRRPLP
jgi:two-component system, cell cycle sensor histidine kinase and response regulator CckA